MALLIVFAFVAGAATAVSPCVLPVLPVALSAGVTGGRRRPLGVVTGLALSFTFATVALVYVIDALGLPDDFVRTLAIAVLLVFGLSLLIPRLGARLEAALGRLVPARARRPAGSGEGFGSGLVLGLSLGLVYAPCAGPILAGVITVSAAQTFTAGRLAVALAYGIGTAVVLYALMIGGRRLTRRLSGQSARLQLATGAVMVLVAVLMLGDYDLRFQTAIANDLPAFLVNPSKELEESGAAKSRLADLRGDRRPDNRARPHATGAPLPVLGNAPDFAGTQTWFNTAGGRALTLAKLRGHPVLVDFWTYTCINCIRTLPYLKAWDAALPEGRARDRRRAHARVPVRARRVERARRDRPEPPSLSGGPGQRPSGLERVPEPVLAGLVFPGWRGSRALRPLRRGRLRPRRRT